MSYFLLKRRPESIVLTCFVIVRTFVLNHPNGCHEAVCMPSKCANYVRQFVMLALWNAQDFKISTVRPAQIFAENALKSAGICLHKIQSIRLVSPSFNIFSGISQLKALSLGRFLKIKPFYLVLVSLGSKNTFDVAYCLIALHIKMIHLYTVRVKQLRKKYINCEVLYRCQIIKKTVFLSLELSD